MRPRLGHSYLVWQMDGKDIDTELENAIECYVKKYEQNPSEIYMNEKYAEQNTTEGVIKTSQIPKNLLFLGPVTLNK